MGAEAGLGFFDLSKDADPEDQLHYGPRRSFPGSEIGRSLAEIKRRRFEIETEKLRCRPVYNCYRLESDVVLNETFVKKEKPHNVV